MSEQDYALDRALEILDLGRDWYGESSLLHASHIIAREAVRWRATVAWYEARDAFIAASATVPSSEQTRADAIKVWEMANPKPGG